MSTTSDGQEPLLSIVNEDDAGPWNKKKEYILPMEDGMKSLWGPGVLQQYAARCLDIAREHPEVRDAEVFVATRKVYRVPISYSSALPSEVANPRLSESAGIGMRFVFKDGRIGSVGARSAFTKGTINALIELAREDAVHDPDFTGLPIPIRDEGAERAGGGHDDEEITKLGSAGVCGLAHRIARGALNVYDEAVKNEDDKLTNFTLHGELCVAKEEMAVKSTTGIDASDAVTKVSASVMSGRERAYPGKDWGLEDESKARYSAAAVRLKDFNPEEIGASAARKAIGLSGGKRIESGRYTVIFSPQAVSELVAYVIAPSLDLTGHEFCDSVFPMSEVGGQVMSEKLSIYDDPALPGSISSRDFTHEGIPTKKTVLVDRGVLRDFIKDTYYANKYGDLLDAVGMDKTPRNGFRLEEGMSRPGWSPSPTFTNFVVEGHDAVPLEKMLSDLEEGETVVYIDQLWYSYPTHKGRPDTDHPAGSMTSTSQAGSYLLEKKDGKLVRTLIKPNTFRLFASARDIFSGVEQASIEREDITGWASNYTARLPHMKCRNIELRDVAKYMDARK